MDRAFVVGKVIDMKFNDLNPTSKVKKMLRKRAIKNVEEHISYQQKKDFIGFFNHKSGSSLF